MVKDLGGEGIDTPRLSLKPKPARGSEAEGSGSGSNSRKTEGERKSRKGGGGAKMVGIDARKRMDNVDNHCKSLKETTGGSGFGDDLEEKTGGMNSLAQDMATASRAIS